MSGNSELIIYFYHSNHIEKENVKQMFIDACAGDVSEEESYRVKEKIYVVLYNGESSKKMFTLKNDEEI